MQVKSEQFHYFLAGQQPKTLMDGVIMEGHWAIFQYLIPYFEDHYLTLALNHILDNITI